MKHVSKALLLVLVLALAVGVFSACNNLKGLTKQSEAFGSPETVSRNKEPYSTTLIPYESVEQALGGDYATSPYYKSLNGEWDFTIALNPSLMPEGYQTKKYSYEISDAASIRKNEEDPATWGKISIPSNWELAGYDTPTYTYNTYPWGNDLVAPNVSESYNPVGIYRNMVEVPSDWSNRQVYVTFEGVASCVYVYVNGALVGYAEDSYTGKTFNITEAVNFGAENLVVFEVYKYCDGSYLEANDSIKYGGIYRDVYLYSAPDLQIRDFTYDMQMSGDDALMNVTVALASYEKPSGDLYVNLSVYDADGNCILQPTKVGTAPNFSGKPATTANAYLGEVGSRVRVPAPKLWTAETPNLYTVVLELKDGNEVLDLVSKRIGFKTVGITLDDSGRQSFVLNGEVVTLRGILYNENSPVNGMVVSRDEMISDIKMMKELNVNAVRSPGRPLSEEFISLCDEYGLYVIDDMSLNSNPYSEKDESSIPGDQSVWQNACLDRLLNVVYRDKNSASVIMWTVGNNSGMGSNFSVLRSWLTSADNRLIIYDDDESASDLYIAADLSLNDFVQVLNDKTNKKAVLVQDAKGGLLSNGGNFGAYADLMDEYDNFQGGFFAIWSDNAIYWPTSTKNASAVLKETPYNAENADLYKLTYAGGWGENLSARDSYQSLSGIVTADRKLQSDAKELKNALSPIYVSVVDAKAGSYRIVNRNSFTDLASTYVVSYEVTDGKNVIKSGTLSDLNVAAGESTTVALDYGTDVSKGNYYVYFTVKYKTAPSWLSGNDLTVFAKQFSLQEEATVSKDGSVQTHTGDALNLSIFQAPEVYVSNYTFSKGQLYVSNPSNVNFSELYSISWTVYEKHLLWESPRWIVYDEGSIASLNVAPGAKSQLVTLPVNTTGAASEATYAAHIVLTSKVDIAGVPAGTQFVYALNTDDTSNIPFRPDPARNAIEVGIDEETQAPIMGPALQDKEPPETDDDWFEVPKAPESYEGSSILLLQNNNVTFRVDADTGLITQYTVGNKDIFVDGIVSTPSMIANMLRNPSGAELLSNVVAANSQKVLTELSQNNAETKTLPNNYKITKVSNSQYRIELEYVWVTYPTKTMRAYAYDTYYTVVYDVYSDGEIQVSVKYQPTVKATVPMELSSVMTLTSDFKTMSWFGMGSGESYSDKNADNRIGTYKNVAIVDQLGSDYLYATASGDKTEIRWMSLERADGSGILITSDTDLFAVNVSKDYPWNTAAYVASGNSAAKKDTVLRVIGQQKGLSANSLFDQEYTDADYIEPGVNYSYSFRIVPVTKGYDADAICKTVLNSGTKLSVTENINFANNSFALTNAAATSTYLSVLADGSVDVQAALGNASQYWIKEKAGDMDVADAFRIKSVSKGLYLSPVSRDLYGTIAAEAELTLGTYRGLRWQNWIYDNSELYVNGYSNAGYYALYVAGSGNLTNAGARLTLKAARSENQSKWTIVADENDPTRIRIQNALSGKYLTVVDQLTYSNPLVADVAYRARNYNAKVNWSSYSGVANAKPYTSANKDEWIGADYYVTQWDLLPADSQMWTFVPANGGYLMVNKQTGKALTVADGTLVQADVTNAAEQIWSVVACDGMYGIVNKATDMALTLRSVNGATVLTVQAWDSLAIQKWNFAYGDDLKVNIEAGDNWYK